MGNPPLVFVLSEKDCSMLLFPFINSEGDDLVECVVLPEIPIWVSKKAEEGALLNRQLLVVILLFCARVKKYIWIISIRILQVM